MCDHILDYEKARQDYLSLYENVTITPEEYIISIIDLARKYSYLSTFDTTYYLKNAYLYYRSIE